MKRNRLVPYIILPAVLLLLGALVFMPLTPSTLTAISVVEQHQNSNETYSLCREQSGQMIAALQGPAPSERPEKIEAVFDLTLHLHAAFPRRYEVYVTSDREVYLKRSPGNRLIRSDNAPFFYTHAAFQSIYPYREIPPVFITVPDQKIIPRVESSSWQFLKWDNNWYAGNLSSPPENTAPWPVLDAAEQGLALEVAVSPDSIALQVTDPAGATVFDQPLGGKQLPTFERNGLYEYRLNLAWEDLDRPYRGHYDVSFAVMMELPPSFEMPDKIVQGELAAFYVHNLPRGVKPVLELELDHQFRFYPLEEGYVAYLPTHYGTAPGAYVLSYGLEGESLQEKTLVVLPRDFHIQHLSVDESIVASTRNEAAYAQFSRYFPQARETSAAERYYSEPFLLPVSGRLTTEFGQTRYVNNEPTSSRHSGLDIAAPTGTPVLAANCGHVTLAMDLILTGNTVVIDHGQGLFSVYYHLHELAVEEGQIMERGETIGTVGSTGFSTGPHLHFTMSYYRHNLEPGHFLVGEAITFENAPLHLQQQ